MADDEQVRTGSCLCGAVTVTVTGQPKAKMVCHCKDCRSWTGGCSYASLWPEDKCKVEGELMVFAGDCANKVFSPDGKFSNRCVCAKCGSNICNKHPAMGLIDVCAGKIFEAEGFKPDMHIWYEQRVMDIVDGLPKFKDVPGAFGGSDETVPETAK